MRLLVALGALWLFVATLPAMAQLQVSAQTERSHFLLYERVDVLVSILNNSGMDIVLDNNEGHPWLSFLLSRHDAPNYMPVRQERQANFAPLTLKAGETKILRVNLTPIFSFREEGDYRASAVIDLPGQDQIISDFVPFSVTKGQTIWSESRPVEGSTRVYSLLRFSPSSDRTQLYLRVEDPSENIVYANIGLGEVVALLPPDVYFDPQGNIHVLHPFALGTYAYTRADSNGKILVQRVFKTVQEIPPRLHKMDDGNVIVWGGQEQNPDQAREKLSNGQVGAKPAAQPTSTTVPDMPQ